jgi:adenosylcobinamide-phosphate synthase
MGIEGLAPSAALLLAGLLLDVVFGDPQVRWHPIRLIGNTLSFFENELRRRGHEDYRGGCLLLILLALTWVVIPCAVILFLYYWTGVLGLIVHLLSVYILFATRDLIDHVRAVQHAARREDLAEARLAIGRLVGRDTERMDIPACRRAAIESLSESFVDGFLSPLFWYVLLGLPGLLLFKVASTMDSMVGYKTPRYLHFGRCGARLDDAMNFVPARAAWLLLCGSGFLFYELSPGKGWRIGLEQHSIVPGPNPGWTEATMAGLLQRRLIGPIWKKGELVTEVWLGDANDPPAGSDDDVSRALRLTIAACLVAVTLAALVLYELQWFRVGK